MHLKSEDRLIVALDVPSAAAAQKIVIALGDSVRLYKVGMQLYTAEGPQVVRDLVGSGRQVFLDLKYHDIPNTVASAVREAAQLGVSMLTVHASGGEKMLRAAAEAAMRSSGRPLPAKVPCKFSRLLCSPAWTNQIFIRPEYREHCLIKSYGWLQ